MLAWGRNRVVVSANSGSRGMKELRHQIGIVKIVVGKKENDV